MIIICQLITGTINYGLIKESNKMCMKAGKEGNYTTLELAFDACNQSKACKSVYDNKCDSKGPFALCNGFGNISISMTHNSCIYRKMIGKILKKSGFVIFKFHENNV